MKRLYSLLLIATLSLTTVLLWVFWYDIVSTITTFQSKFHKLLSDHIGQFNENPTTSGLLLIAISFAYGVFHAAGPGHGKAVLVTYLSTQKETLKQGIFISFSAAILQAIVAVAIVSVISLLLNQTFRTTNLMSLRAEQISYVLLMLFGLYLVVQSGLKIKSRYGLAKKKIAEPIRGHSHNHSGHEHNHSHHGHDHHHSNHDHHHDGHPSEDHPSEDHPNAGHQDCCQHSYAPKESISLWQTLGVIFSMGARPCTGAIVVLIYSKVVGIYWVGVAATLLMGLGTGLTVASLGFLTIYFRERLTRLVSGDTHQHHQSLPSLLLPTFGGAVLISLGWGLFQASIAPAIQHPLF